jgi:hypothetical protein
MDARIRANKREIQAAFPFLSIDKKHSREFTLLCSVNVMNIGNIHVIRS